jgi:hypothetical protein
MSRIVFRALLVSGSFTFHAFVDVASIEREGVLMNRCFCTMLGVACATVIGLSGPLQVHGATVIISESFDPISAGAALQVGYTFGDTTASFSGISAGTGLTGDSWQIVNTTSNNGNGYSGVGAQYQNGGVSGNTSTNLSHYTLSFDAKSTGGSLNIQIETWLDGGFTGGITGKLNTAPANPGYGNDQQLHGEYTHYELNLGDTSIFMDDSGLNPAGGTYQLTFQFNGSGSAPFTQTLDVDNLTLTMVVPEPMTASLICAGLFATVFHRRRNG